MESNRVHSLMLPRMQLPRFLQTLLNKNGMFGVLANLVLSRRYEKTHATYCPFRPKNLKTYCCNMFGWFGEVGGTRKNHTHRCVSSFYYLAERKVRKTTKIIFRVFNTCNSSPILLFCPRNPKSYFSWKIQKDARRKMIEICLFKS